MEVEGRDPVEQPQLVHVLIDRERRDLLGAFDHGGPQPELIHDRHVERLHQRPGVLAEALLPRHQLVAVVLVLHLALLHVGGEADVVVRADQQAGVVPLEPLPDGRDLLRRGLLLGDEMVQPEHQQGVGVRQDPLVDRQPVAGLVDALEHGDRMTGHLADRLLEVERGAVEQLQRARDALQEVHLVPLGALVGRPRHPPHLGHGREAVVQLRGVPVGLPRVAPGPVDAHPPLAAACICGGRGPGCRSAPAAWFPPCRAPFPVSAARPLERHRAGDLQRIALERGSVRELLVVLEAQSHAPRRQAQVAGEPQRVDRIPRLGLLLRDPRPALVRGLPLLVADDARPGGSCRRSAATSASRSSPG